MVQESVRVEDAMSMFDDSFEDIRLVLDDRVGFGSLFVEDGRIARIDVKEEVAGPDLSGDFLMPGLVELHTDHLETHYALRPGVLWNPVAAVQAHDAQIAGSGITTVFDALRLGTDQGARITSREMRILADAIAQGRSDGRLRADHFIHLRCEVSTEDLAPGLDLFKEEPLVCIASLMDHTPGQRQFASLDAYRTYHSGNSAISDSEFENFVRQRLELAAQWSAQNRQLISDHCLAAGIVLASHDDGTTEHIDEAVGHHVGIAEFPTTNEAARAARRAGLKVLMGAPNLVRGGSHSGNASARYLAENGLLDILSSDYVPFSLLFSVFMLAEGVDAISLPDAVRMVSRTPAQAMGLDDRGSLAIGKRADLLLASYRDGIPVVRGVWREGNRIA